MLDGSAAYLIVMVWGLWLLLGGRLERRSPGMTAASLFFAFYLSQLVAVTLFPLPIDPSVIERGQRLEAAGFGPGNNLMLFDTVRDFADSEAGFVNQIVGNFLLLVPLGLMAPLLWEKFRSWKRAAALVVAATLAIEFSQLGISRLLGYTYRSFDVDDLWLNAFGGTLAAIAACWAVRQVRQPVATTSVATGLRETVPCQSVHG